MNLNTEDRRARTLRWILEIQHSPALFHRLPEVADFISLGYEADVEKAIERFEAIAAALPRKPDDLATIVFLRAYLPSSYWAELWRNRPGAGAADFVPLLRLMAAAGATGGLGKSQSIVRMELPLVGRELVAIAAITLGGEIGELVYCANDEEVAWFRGALWGEAIKSLHFDEALIRRVVAHFGSR